MISKPKQVSIYLQIPIKCIKNFQMFKFDLEKAEESEIKLPTSVES